MVESSFKTRNPAYTMLESFKFGVRQRMDIYISYISYICMDPYVYTLLGHVNMCPKKTSIKTKMEHNEKGLLIPKCQ